MEDLALIKDAVEPFEPTESDFLERGILITAEDDGVIMACGGIVIESDTEGTIWCKVSKECSRKSFAWARTMREAFSIMKKSVGNLRISTYILDGFCKGDRLAKLIGLERSNETKIHNGNTYIKYMAVT